MLHYSIVLVAVHCLRSPGWRAQQELTTATYLTAMKPATVGDTTQHYPGKKTELGLLYLCLKMSSKDREKKGEIFGVKMRPLARDGLCTSQGELCVVNWGRAAS